MLKIEPEYENPMVKQRIIYTEEERFKYISRAAFEKSFLYMPCKGVIVAVRPSESIPPGNISAATGGGWLVAFSQGDEILDDIKHE